MSVNVENCEKLIAWLEAGAPHAIFDMEYGLAAPSETSVHSGAPTDCGTVCCIAGAAWQMSKTKDGTFPAHPDPQWIAHYPAKLFQEAAEWLGFARDIDPNSFAEDLFLELFHPDYAPLGCTPQQAADAVRRMMNGEPAWSEETIS